MKDNTCGCHGASGVPQEEQNLSAGSTGEVHDEHVFAWACGEARRGEGMGATLSGSTFLCAGSARKRLYAWMTESNCPRNSCRSGSDVLSAASWEAGSAHPLLLSGESCVGEVLTKHKA